MALPLRHYSLKLQIMIIQKLIMQKQEQKNNNKKKIAKVQLQMSW